MNSFNYSIEIMICMSLSDVQFKKIPGDNDLFKFCSFVDAAKYIKKISHP